VLELSSASAQDLSPTSGSFAVLDRDVGDTLTPAVVGSPAVRLDGAAFALPAGAAALTAAGAFTLTGRPRTAARPALAIPTIRALPIWTSCGPVRA